MRTVPSPNVVSVGTHAAIRRTLIMYDSTVIALQVAGAGDRIMLSSFSASVASESIHIAAIESIVNIMDRAVPRSSVRGAGLNNSGR